MDVIGVKDDNELEEPISDLLMGTSFWNNATGYYNVRKLLKKTRGSLELLEAINIKYDVDVLASIKAGSFEVDGAYAFLLHLHSGTLPVLIITAMASLVEDGLNRGQCLFPYEETSEEPNAKRVKTTRSDRFSAFSRYLDNPNQGVKRAVTRPQRQDSSSFFERRVSQSTLDSNNSLVEADYEWLANTQQCGTGASEKKEEKRYKNVLEEGTLLV